MMIFAANPTSSKADLMHQHTHTHIRYKHACGKVAYIYPNNMMHDLQQQLCAHRFWWMFMSLPFIQAATAHIHTWLKSEDSHDFAKFGRSSRRTEKQLWQEVTSVPKKDASHLGLDVSCWIRLFLFRSACARLKLTEW